MKRLASIAALAAFTLASSARAETTAKEFLEVYASPDGESLGEMQISATEQGLHQINKYLEKTAGQKQVYCQPDALILTGPQLADMLTRAVNENSALKNMPLSGAMLIVLQKTFPCAATTK
jgi:hypothetical protein